MTYGLFWGTIWGVIGEFTIFTNSQKSKTGYFDRFFYHFGDAIDLEKILEKMPSDKPVMGNISPTAEFSDGTPESMRKAVNELKEKCEKYPNFVLSSGCDIPYHAKWENIRTFFEANRSK